MPNSYFLFIQNLLKNIPPAEIIPSGIKTKLVPDDQIKAVVFDIYGTLIISPESDKIKSLIQTLDYFNLFMPNLNKIEVCNNLNKIIINEIFSAHQIMKENGNDHPEIDIIEIYTKSLNYCYNKKWIKPFHSRIKKIILAYEIFSLRIFPMPNLKAMLEELKILNIRTGIISNAQFYTEKILAFMLSNNLYAYNNREYFNKNLIYFSYQYKVAKPSRILFTLLIEKAYNKFGLNPNQILYVGNDLQNDIIPAKNIGLKTGLFAGDLNSFNQPLNVDMLKNTDFVFTNLNQIPSVLK